MKFCKDCKHYVPGSGFLVHLFKSDARLYGRCMHPKNVVVDLVTGKEKEGICCSFQRFQSGIFPGYCCKSGEWFEPKEGSK